MNRFTAFLIGLFLLPGAALSQSSLEVEITGFRTDQGALLIQLMDEHQNVVLQEQSPVKEHQCRIVFSDLNPGQYGVRFFHDENLSGQMETNVFGKPIEGYGFSNNAMAPFGPPEFKKWLFDLKGDKKISLKPRY